MTSLITPTPAADLRPGDRFRLTPDGSTFQCRRVLLGAGRGYVSVGLEFVLLGDPAAYYLKATADEKRAATERSLYDGQATLPAGETVFVIGGQA